MLRIHIDTHGPVERGVRALNGALRFHVPVRGNGIHRDRSRIEAPGHILLVQIQGIVVSVRPELSPIAVIADHDFVMPFVHDHAMRIFEASVHSHDLPRRFGQILGGAAVNLDGIQFLRGYRQFSAAQSQRKPPRLMWHKQPARRHRISVRLIGVNGYLIAGIVIHGVDFVVLGIHGHAGDKPHFRCRSHDAAARLGHGVRFAAAGAVVDQQAVVIFVADGHQVIGGIQRDSIEDRIRISDGANGSDIAAANRGVRRGSTAALRIPGR